MGVYILRRILLLFPTLIGITVIVFAVMALSPGGVAASLLNREGGLNPNQRKQIEAYYTKKFGLDKPLPLQYLRWLNRVSFIGVKEAGSGWPTSTRVGFKAPDLGESVIRHRPVLDLIEESLPITLLLNVLSFPLTVWLALQLGISSAVHRGKLLDVSSGSILLGLWSVPQIWAGVMLVGYLASRQHLYWFQPGGLNDLRADEFNFLPTFHGGFQRGWLLDYAWHLVLPVLCMSYGGLAFTAKLQRSAMLENFSADYARTARAKGVAESQVVWGHVFRNSLLPLITSFASLLPSLIGGALIVETIFSLPGMGKLGVDSVTDKDPEMVMSITLVASLLGLVSYLISDLCYAVADPRVKFED